MPWLSGFQQRSSLLWNVLQDFQCLPVIPASHWGCFVLIAHYTGKGRMCSQAAIQTGTELYTQHASRDRLTGKKSSECSGSVFLILVSRISGMRIAEGRTIPAEVGLLPASSSVWSISRTISSIRILMQSLGFFSHLAWIWRWTWTIKG